MENKILYINPDFFKDKTEENILFYNDKDIIVITQYELDLLNFFDGKHKLSQIAELLAKQYTGYEPDDFREFVELMVEKGVLIEGEQTNGISKY